MLDKKSLRILKILQEKARIPNTEVSRLVGLAPSAVLERIRKMELQGIIDGYEVRLNPERFLRNQVAFINVEYDGGFDGDGAIGQALAAIEEIQEVHYIAGKDSYLVKLRVADTRELGNVLRDKIITIEGVLSTNTSTVLQTYKETARISIR
ncbi:Lrp/AsnC family transcriptional regulator [Desulfopila inferna]|uniref:Lrp/AsnC family transcriptional regulator n=1 Tax=Desulfopila inferna TaxID=468528 RepID=UPI00196393E7|nr:Lrp/AsnC family transcriptional regulator [Desulfopila inferna]MBM9603247.1 Lrp/AsnC family transcriptional regulator [Desulfopila inferna]